MRFAASDAIELASRILPTLAAKIRITYRTNRIGRARAIAPKLLFETISDAKGESLTVIPHLVYGDPKIAEVIHGKLRLDSPKEVPIRDVVAESALLRELSNQHGMKLGEGKQLQGEQGALFLARSKRFLHSGSQSAEYSTAVELLPTHVADSDSVRLVFKSEDGRDEIVFE